MHSLCTFLISYQYVRNEDFVFLKPQIQRLTAYDSVLDNFSYYAGIRWRYMLWSERAFNLQEVDVRISNNHEPNTFRR